MSSSNSAISIWDAKVSYETSAPTQNDWGQLPLTKIPGRLEVTGLISNIYAVIDPTEELMDPHFKAEMDAWDAASNEALINFEGLLKNEKG